MPSTSSSAAVRTTPGTLFPHLLLDEVMPTLSGSEWALLCVVVRQTLGWHDHVTGGRKASDWLSHRQLKARTGRGSDAVCSAIDSLVRRDLIQVTNEAGHVLATSAERRRALRLFYALSPNLLARLQAARHPEPKVSQKPQGNGPTSALSAVKAPPAVRLSRFRKSETTKETGTKYRQEAFGKTESRLANQKANQSRTPFNAVRQEDSKGCGCLLPDTLPLAVQSPGATVRPEAPDPELAPFLRFYREKLGHHRGAQDEPAVPSIEEQARLQAALDRYGTDRLQQLAEVFFKSESVLLHRHGFGLGAFLEVLPTLSVLRLKPASRTTKQVP